MKMTVKQMCMTAVFIALTFVITRFIQVPIPLGYFNVGNSIILLSCVMLPSPAGILVGSIGSALADLTSYPVYTIPTLIIKLLMPLVFYMLYQGKHKYSYMLAALVSTLIPLAGYTIVGGVLYGGLVAGLAQLPGLLVEYVANFAIFVALYRPCLKIRKLTES